MELLVWYGSQYAEQLGIIADKMVLKPSENFQKFSGTVTFLNIY